MIKSVTIINYLGEAIKLELRAPEKSGFLVQRIEGLGPSKASINSTEAASMDGAIYNSARVSSRNIVLYLQFLDIPSVEYVRQLSYKYFPIKKQVCLIIETDNRICQTYGYVESNEPNIFSNQETTQISIICPDPYLYSYGVLGTQVTVFSGIDALFEFPFSNESLTENLLEFSSISTMTENTVYYAGDAEIGVLINIHALGEATNITIYNLDTREVLKIDTQKLLTLTGSGLVNGDEIIISTVKGEKYVLLLRLGEYTNILNCLDKTSNWFQLTKGDNLFAYTADTGVTNLQFRIENRIIYEGV